VLFFAESLTLCHVTRPLVLARSLANGDYELHVACPPEYQRLYEGLTVQLHPLNSLPSAQSLARVNAGKPVFAPETLRNYVREDLKLIKQIDPDCIVGDMRLSLSVSARLTETPYAAIVNAYWSPWAQPRYDAPELPITRLLGTGLTVPLIRAAMPLAFAMHCRPLNTVRREHGLTSLGSDLRQVYSDADYVLYADASELVPTGQLPANHVYLGPILWSHPSPLPAWWKSIPQIGP
jgi:UDP:flavonoid glycosyltransferase YjiC (YdhE family)